MKTPITLLRIVLFTIVLASAPTLHAAIIFVENFSMLTTFSTSGQANIEGTFANVTTSGIVVSADSSITGEQLVVTNTTSSFRGIGIAILPEDTGPAGIYNFSFDFVSIVSISNGLTQVSPDDVATVNVFSGSGFDTGSTADSLGLNIFDPALFTASGGASVDTLAAEQFTMPQNDINVSFEYDGTGPIVIFLGILNGSGTVQSDNGFFFGNPQPAAIFDNLELTSLVPEPSTAISILIGSIFLIIRRCR